MARRRHRRVAARLGTLLAHGVLMAGALVMVMPMIWMVATSLKPAPEIARWPPVFLPQAPSLENYTGAFATAPFGRFFLNSVFIAGVATIFVAATSLVAGAVFAKYRFPGRQFLFALVLATAIVPFEAYMIPLYLQLVSIEWINTYQGIILPYLFMAFGIFLMRQHVASAIPSELMEAARVDGAGEWWILRRVIAPLSGNALAAVGIFAFIQGWGIFIWPLLIANDQLLFNMELGLTAFQFRFSSDTGKLMAGSVVSVVPMLAIFLLLRRRIIENMALTGLKG
ncbi:carbohydrate ABC transporter permease [Limobrevibacterium gyesilva]|uniref:Carbohydrate ABC transporter permease n=1 Tax=Limobrevibacterium gyesilva TaxID=2991712 RepID=A0AA42CCF0_9PROT|nr:carbohydrate ABC transporter permease [Limobrevibacterium gyesilva]MCW3473238.1 carbohydrate ABC transporter permease [Limobrevibacterium gyesilva]